MWEGEEVGGERRKKKPAERLYFFMAFSQDQQNKLYEMLFEKLIGLRRDAEDSSAFYRCEKVAAAWRMISVHTINSPLAVDKRNIGEARKRRGCVHELILLSRTRPGE